MGINVTNKLLVWLGIRDKVDDDEYWGCPHLSKKDMNRITEETAKKTIEMLEDKIYLRIGRGVVRKFLWLVGLATVSVVAWLHSKGIL